MLKKPIWNTIVQIGGKAITVLISLVTTGILTRRLNIDSYGNYVLVTSAFVFFDSLADFGTKIIGVREMAAGDKKFVKGIFWLRNLMAGIATVGGLVMVAWWNGFAGFRGSATVALLMIGLTSLAGFLEIVWQTQLKMGKKVIIDLLFPLLFLGWILTTTNISLGMVFGIYVIARVVSLIGGYWWVKNDWSFEGYTKIDKATLVRVFKVTWPMGVYMLAFASYDRLVDSAMIKTFLGAKEVAWYGLAYKMYGVLIQPAYFFVNSIFPILSGKDEGKRKLFWESAGLLLAGVLILIVGVEVLAPWMVTVLAGSGFGPAVGVIRILVFGCLFSYMGHLVGFSLISKGGQGEMVKIAAIGLLFNVIANYLLIPRMGINGAAYVTVGNEALGLMMMMWMLKRKME
ncbi:MAG: polysaccharide biosynthesis C-terminal domain-containing protein [Candidatus Shapirobacteria bacterium]|nr:polysaccharide biosynthesis C-terminal domain-containing protein [Candidatus Shapirobacteria bacterium]